MPRPLLGSVLRYVHQKTGRARTDEASDAELLGRFADRRDEAAFKLLVCRHGPLVLGVCQRLLRHDQDSEDAFQATFLTLVRKAGSIGKREALSSWLYKVAFRIACRARTRTLPLTNHAAALEETLAPESETDLIWRDLRSVLDQEVARLPESYRRPILLCYLEGKTNEEAAQHLGCPKGTLSARLARARDRLRGRLTRRGLALSSGLLATILAEKAAAGAMPAVLLRSTVSAALTYASGTTAGLVSLKAIAMTEGVLRMMWYSKMKMLVVALLAIVIGGTGIGFIVGQVLAGDGPYNLRAGQAAPAKFGQQEGSKEDPKGEIAALRAEIGKLRQEIDSALKEIKSLKDALRQAAPRDQGALYRGKPVGFWLEQLKDADTEFRTEAVRALSSLAGKNKELVPVLVETLKDRFVGSHASTYLAGLGPEVIPALSEVLKDHNSPAGLANAAHALRRLGPKAKSALPFLIQGLGVDDWSARDAIVEALGGIGSEAKPALPALVDYLGFSIKALERDAKEKKMPVALHYRSRPFTIIEVMEKIDADIRMHLPNELGALVFGPPSSRERMTLEQCQEAYEALRKIYKEKK